MSRGISFLTQFPSALRDVTPGSSSLVKFTKVRIVLYRADNTVALDTLVNFPDGADSLALSLEVPLSPTAPATGEPLSLNLKYINATGDTVFKGTAPVTAAPASATTTQPAAPVVITVIYTGTGSNAAGVLITPRLIAAVTGDPLNFTARAIDANGNTVANTPIVWSSLDPSIASITNAAAGVGVAGATRGIARIVAALLTGPKDTVFVAVQPKAAALAIVSGNNQTGVVKTKLASPVVVKVTGPDGLGVSQVGVIFQIEQSSVTVLSGADGTAKIDWTLGTVAGTQTLTATSAGLTGSPITFSSTATAATATLLSVKVQPAASTAAGATLAPVEFAALDPFGNLATSFTGAVSVALDAGAANATLGGTLSVNAVAGVARFTTLSLNRVGTGYTLLGSASGLASISSGAFAITAIPAQSCAVQAGNGLTATVNTNVGTNPAVLVTDALGNPVKDVVVTWTVTTGSGSVGAASSTTDATGVASTSWKLGTVVGTQSITASATGLTGCPLVFTATATAATASVLSVKSQPTVSTVAGATLAPVEFAALDPFGNLATSFTGAVGVALGAGAANATLSGTVSVNAVAGVARFSTLSLNRIGTGYTLLGSANGLTSIASSAFAITAGAAKSCSVQAGNGLTTTVNTNVGTNPAVLVADALGNPVKDVVVTWAVTTGGGSVGSASSTSDASGIASTTWKLGTVAGAQSITASATGLTGCPLVFTATATAATASQLAVQTQPSTSTVAGTALTPLVFVAKDAFGNAATSFVGSVAAVLSSVTTLGGTTTVTAVAGVATFSALTINAANTGYTVTASATGLTSATTSSFSIAPAAVAFCNPLQGNVQTYFAGATLPVAPGVQVTDAFGNFITGTSVTWAVTAGAGSVSAVSTTTSGGFTGNAWTLGSATGAQSVTATCGGVSQAGTFTATSLARGMKLNVGDGVSNADVGLSAGVTIAIPIVVDLTFPEGGNLASISFDLNFDASKFTFSKTTVGAFGTVLENTSSTGTGKISVGVFSPTKAAATTTVYTIELIAKSTASTTTTAVTATITAAGQENGSNASIAARNLNVTIKP